MAPKNWAKCKARKLLIEDYLAGKIPLIHPHPWCTFGLQLTRPEYAPFSVEEFQQRLVDELPGVLNTMWKNGETKDLLDQDLRDGTVSMETGAAAYQIAFKSRPEYKAFPYTFFKARLVYLQKKISTGMARNQFEEAALLHDRSIHPKPTKTCTGAPRWEGHAAAKQLPIDMAAYPDPARIVAIDLWGTRLCYMEFELEVFRKHIDQELKTTKFKRYLLDKKGWDAEGKY